MKHLWFFLVFLAIFGVLMFVLMSSVSPETVVETQESVIETAEPVIEEDVYVSTIPEYTVVNTGEYVRDGQKCGIYRMVVDKNLSEADLFMVAYTAFAADDYYLNTAFFYEYESDVENIGFYTIAMIEQFADELTTCTFQSIDYETIESLRAGDDDSEVDSIDEVKESSTSSSVTLGEKNALQEAKSYLSVMAFSYDGLIEQLEYEGYSKSESTYGADNCGANWNEQAAKTAQSYLDIMSFSRDGLIDQLEYEGFTSSQAKYGATAVGY